MSLESQIKAYDAISAYARLHFPEDHQVVVGFRSNTKAEIQDHTCGIVVAVEYDPKTDSVREVGESRIE